MKKKLMIFMLLLLSFSLSFIICFNITKFNIAKDNQYINNIEDNEVIQSERNDQIEETKELEEEINDVTVIEEEKDEIKDEEEVKETNSNSINNGGNNSNNTNDNSNNSSNKNNTTDNSNGSSNTQNNINKNEISSGASNTEIVDNNSEQVTEESKEDEIPSQEEQTEELSDNSVNIHHLDYPTHKGRIDCTDYNKCMDDSLTIYFSYKKIISNVFYVEVISNSGTTLGYFTEYVFKEHTYSSIEECKQVGSEIKNLLSDRITGFECDSSGTLKINTDY